MAAILNAIFGTTSESEQQSTTANTGETVSKHSASSSECLHTSAVADDVQVKSVISSETQADASINTKFNIDTLLTQLRATYAQVDQHSRARTAEINEQVEKSVAGVLENTRRQQEELLIDANRRHLIVDNEYQIQLQKAVEALDAVKAKSLADLERDLQVRQQIILNEAKKEIDVLNDQANAAKLNVLLDAQEHAKQNIDDLANQVAAIGQKETENVLQSTTTTVITSQAHAAETVVTTPLVETTTATNEQQMTSTGDKQMQVAIRSPTELVAVPTVPTATDTTIIDVVPAASESTTTSTETSVTSASADVSSNTTTTVETAVKTS